MPRFEENENTSPRLEKISAGHLNIVEAPQLALRDPVLMTPTEIISFNQRLSSSSLPDKRKSELAMGKSAGMPAFTNEDFLKKTSDAQSFAANLTCYRSPEMKNNKLIAATIDDLLDLKHDPYTVVKFSVVGSHLYKPAFWRLVEDEPGSILPLVRGISVYRAERHMEQDGRDLIEFADKLSNVSKKMAALTDRNDPGITKDGAVDLKYWVT
jgi:hypothetical protein